MTDPHRRWRATTEKKFLQNSQSDQIKNTPNIQIQRLLALPVLEGFKRPTPTTRSIRDENIDTFAFDFGLDLTHELLDLIRVPDVGGHGYRAAADIGDRIELCGGGGEVRGVPRGDDHQRAAGLQQRG